MADDTLIVYDPTAAPRIVGAELAARPDSLAGRTVGILDNGKANAGLLMGALVDLLRDQHGVANVIVRKKPVAGPAPARAVEELVSQCAAVLVGSADWGSCTAWSVQAAIVLEKRGVPTAVVGTDEFLALGRLEARSRGIADLPIVLTEHPLGGLHEDEVRAKAAAMLTETLQALTGARS